MYVFEEHSRDCGVIRVTRDLCLSARRTANGPLSFQPAMEASDTVGLINEHQDAEKIGISLLGHKITVPPTGLCNWCNATGSTMSSVVKNLATGT